MRYVIEQVGVGRLEGWRVGGLEGLKVGMVGLLLCNTKPFVKLFANKCLFLLLYYTIVNLKKHILTYK
jgi:hypothetical protein